MADQAVEVEQPLSENGEGLVLEQNSLRPFLIAAIVTALVLGFIVVVRIVSPRSAWNLLPLIVFLIAVEGIYTTHWLHHPDRRVMNRSAYRFAEFLVIAFVLRLLTWTLAGGIPPGDAWRAYLLSPLSFFDGTFTVYLLCGVLAWERAVRFSSLLLRLQLSPDEIGFYSLPRQQQLQRYHDRPVDLERPYIFASLLKSWLYGGFVLAFFSALATVDLPNLSLSGGIRNVGRLGLQPEILVALLIYFLVGLWLISQARLSTMRARWLADHVVMRSDVLVTWKRLSLIVLLLVAFIAAFLPIGSTFGIATILQLIIGFIVTLMQLILTLFTLLFLFLTSLFGAPRQVEEAPEQPPSPIPTLPPVQDSPLGETPALVAGGLFWLFITVVVIAALVFFLRDRGYNLNATFIQNAWRALATWLTMLLRGASRQLTTAQRAVRARLNVIRSTEAGIQSPYRFIRLNALSPRQQVRYFYLSTVRRATKQGVPRGEGKTPSEYAQVLKGKWPDANEEIDVLTGAFLKARYSPREFEPTELASIKAIWKRLTRALRRHREQNDGPASDGQDHRLGGEDG